MSTATAHNSAESNPFFCEHDYSEEAVELMRALRSQRVSRGQKESSPTEVLDVLADLGYRNVSPMQLNGPQQAKRFVMALERQKKKRNVTHASCEDVLEVISDLGYRRETASADLENGPGLPICRRRREEDVRESKTERRDNTTPSPQEELDLTDEEHAFLDQLKELREKHGREFASSQELLSIVWTLNYRPRLNNGHLAERLSDDQRAALQIAFTQAIEERLASDNQDEFLTVRSVLKIVGELGFCKASAA